MPDYSKQISTLDGWLNQNKDKQDTPEFQAVVTDLKKLVDSQGVSPSQPEPPVEPAKEDKGFIEKTSESLERRGKMGFEIVSAQKQGEQTWGETVTQLVGKVGIGFASDLVFNGVVEGTQALTPDVFEDPIKNAATYASAKILDNPVGQKGLEALYEGAEAYGEWKKNNPRFARNLEGVINIALVWTPAKGNPGQAGAGLRNLPARTKARTESLVSNVTRPASDKGPLAAAGRRLDEGAKSKLITEREAAILDAITPADGARNNAALIRGGQLSEGGPFTDKKFLPKPEEAAAMRDILDLSNGKSLNASHVFNESNRAITKLEDKIRKFLVGGKSQVYDRTSFRASMDEVKAQVTKENAMLVGSDQASAINTMFDDMIEIADKLPNTAKGLLRARRDYDKVVLKTKPKIFDDNGAGSAMKNANLQIRRKANDIVKEMVPEAGDLLNRQSNIFGAQNAIMNNAAAEQRKWIGRQTLKLQGILGTRSLTTNLFAGAIGIGGLGAAAAGAPLWTYGWLYPLLIYKGGKMVTNSTARNLYSGLIKGTDQAIKKTLSGSTELGKYGTAQTVDLLKSLKADRAALIQLLEEGQ